MEEPYRCGNSIKRILCNRPCRTCYKRSFSVIRIVVKDIDGEETEIVPAEYWSEKNDTRPEYVTYGSNKSFIFDCIMCGHEFLSKLVDCSNRGNWCPYCGGKKLCDNEDCKPCYERSFASVEKPWGRPADFIIGVNPRLLFKNSHKRCTFYCSDCKHDFQAVPYNVALRDWPCSYCKGDELCGSEDCKSCFEKSFASHHRAKFWSRKNRIDPLQVRLRTKKKYLFDCPTCRHSFESEPNNIITNDSWCPYCSVPCRKLCGDEKCKHCWERSLASIVEKKSYIKGQPPLHTIQKGSRKTKYKFICDKGHKFSMRPNNVNDYQWCPMCPKKTETKMYRWLVERYEEENVVCQASFEWCKSPKSGRLLYYDFYLSELDIIIEVDGDQHFRQVSNWCPPEETQKMDRYKERLALKHGISIIRVLQTDVLFDSEDSAWQRKIQKSIDSLAKAKKGPRVISIMSEN